MHISCTIILGNMSVVASCTRCYNIDVPKGIKKPPKAVRAAKEGTVKQMSEYTLEYRGRAYEFPTWREMMEFIEDHRQDAT